MITSIMFYVPPEPISLAARTNATHIRRHRCLSWLETKIRNNRMPYKAWSLICYLRHLLKGRTDILAGFQNIRKENLSPTAICIQTHSKRSIFEHTVVLRRDLLEQHFFVTVLGQNERTESNVSISKVVRCIMAKPR